MGPFSAVIFLLGVIMVLVGRNPNNDDLFNSRLSLKNDGEGNRIQFLVMGVGLIIIAIVMWVFLAVYGEPTPLPDYSSMMNRNSSQ